jgi:hypothetical protein
LQLCDAEGVGGPDKPGHDDVGWLRPAAGCGLLIELKWAAASPTCPRIARASTSLQPCDAEDVDGRDKPGHDDVDAP